MLRPWIPRERACVSSASTIKVNVVAEHGVFDHAQPEPADSTFQAFANSPVTPAAAEVPDMSPDAHGDMNTPESSPSGNVHGMPLAAIMGYGAPELVDLLGFKPKAEPGNIVIVGARDLDTQERKIVKKSGVHVFTMRDIDERGLRDVMSEALKYAMDDTAGIAVSLDMDFVDPADAPGVGTPVRGGVTYREAHLAMEMIADTESMVSLEVVEINPILDEHNRTALLGVELVLSGLGQKIL